MCSPLTQLDFVLNRFNLAQVAFTRGPGMDLLRLREEGGGTEQEISGGFAVFLERVLRADGVLGDAEVDAEYYWHGDRAKMIATMWPHSDVIRRACRRIRFDGSVGIRPDIIVHRRGAEGPNHLVIEVKKQSNKSKAQERFDLLKLEMLTSPDQDYRYAFGMQVLALDSSDTGQRKLEVISIWRNGARVPLVP